MGYCIYRSDIGGNEVTIVGIEVFLLRRGRGGHPNWWVRMEGPLEQFLKT